MTRWLEIPTFVAIAVVVHILVFARGPDSGSAAGGSGGESLISLEAAAPTVVEMVEMWERPPNTMTMLRTEVAAPDAVSTDRPIMPQVEIAKAPRAELLVTLSTPDAPNAPQVDSTPPPPPREPEPEVKKVVPKKKTRPQPRKPAPQKGRKADVNSAGRAGQKAAGSGGGVQAGSGTAEIATASSGQTAKLISVWGAKVRARIERNKRYPRGSRASGNVTVALTVSRDGTLVNYRIKKSSGNAELDQAALGAVARAKRFPKAPAQLTGSSFRFSVVIKLGRG